MGLVSFLVYASMGEHNLRGLLVGFAMFLYQKKMGVYDLIFLTAGFPRFLWRETTGEYNSISWMVGTASFPLQEQVGKYRANWLPVDFPESLLREGVDLPLFVQRRKMEVKSLVSLLVGFLSLLG